MAFVSNALGCQPAPTPDELVCADCGVRACDPDGHRWRNSYFLRDGEVLLRCEDCGERAAAHARVLDICDGVLAEPGVVAALRYLETR